MNRLWFLPASILFICTWLGEATAQTVSFTAVDRPSGASLPFGIESADFNGDGRQDLAVAHLGSFNAVVLLNLGGLNFNQVVLDDLVGRPSDVAAADFNLDGNLDLAVSNFTQGAGARPGPGHITLWLGDGLGGFSLPSPFQFATGYDYRRIVLSEFNGDGRPDLAAAAQNGGPATVLGVSSGGFSAPTVYFNVPRNHVDVASGDLNGDGKTDLAAPVQFVVGVGGFDPNGALALFFLDGATPPALVTPPVNFLSGGEQSVAIEVADFDGDGILDAVVGNAGFFAPSSLSFFRGLGSGSFASPVVQALPGFGFGVGLATADFDGDGRLDIVAGGSGLKFFRGIPGGFAPAISFGGSRFHRDLTTGDFDGDGDIDVAATTGEDQITIYLNTTPLTVAITSVTAAADGFLPSQTFSTFPATVGSSPVTVGGTVSDAAAAVVVNGAPAVVQADGSWTAQDVPLNEGANTVAATATLGNTASASVEVTLDMDLDGDGIQNNVDGKFHPVFGDPIPEFDEFTDEFSDELLNGTTRGKIKERGDRTWLIRDEPNDPDTEDLNEGVRIIVGSGEDEAKVEGEPPCTPATTVTIASGGANFVLSCGSTTVQVTQGSVEVTTSVEVPDLPIIDMMAKVGKDGVIVLTELEDKTVLVNNVGITPITLTVLGSSVTLNPGQSRAVRPVGIDIKPGSDPNSINLNSKGVLPVAILSGEAFDARTVLAETVLFGDPTVEGRVTPVRSGLEDVDGDGRVDMVVFFSMEGIRTVGALDGNSSSAGLIGLTTDNKVIAGLDVVRIVPGASRRAASLPDQPTVYALYEAYPNPFNPSTTIRYQLPKSGAVSLKIYNVLGEVVATLVDQIQEAGYYEVRWSPQLPSGTYLYRLQAGEILQTRKLMLVR